MKKETENRNKEILEIIEKLAEDERGDTPSKNEDLKVENMYDFITGQLYGLVVDSTELREAVRAFGKVRYNQALYQVLREVRKEIKKGKI